MYSHCSCPEDDCLCNVEVPFSAEEQDDIILARILGEAMDYEITATKVCQECTDGWHVLGDDDSRSRKEVNEEPDGE